MIAVVADAAGYRAAIGELPLSTRRAERPAGAIVVVPGIGWVDGALQAAAAGAAAIVIADPEATSAAEVRRLDGAIGVPVVVERPLLRRDVVDTAIGGREGAPASLLTVDGAAGSARFAVVLRDAVGWLRVLGGGALAVRSAGAGPVLLETHDGTVAALSVAMTARGPGWIRAQALGEVLTDVEVEAGAVLVATSSRAGRLVAPVRFESSERLALRRALAAMEASAQPPDIAEIRADAEIAEECMRA